MSTPQDQPVTADALNQELDQAVLSAKRRARIAWGLALLVVVSVGLYLAYTYTVVRQVGPEVVATNARSVASDWLPTLADRSEEQLKKNAPRYTRLAAQQAVEAPDALSEQAALFIGEQIKQRLEKQAKKWRGNLSTQIERLAARAKEAKPNASEREQVQFMLEELAALYGREGRKLVDRVHDRYAARAREAYAYLRRLAEAKELSPAQQREKRILRTVLALLKKWQAETGAGGGLFFRLEAHLPGSGTREGGES